MRSPHGFTLLEMLVVLFIIGVVMSVALLTLSYNDNRRLEGVANELVQIITLAEERAMLQPMVVGLSYSEHQLQFLRLKTAASENKNAWQPVPATLLSSATIPNDIQVNVVANDNPKALQAGGERSPQIIFSTNGEVTPFTIYVGKKGEKPRYAVKGEANGYITGVLLPSP